VSGSRYVSRAANVAARMIGGEMMIMSGRDSSLFSLNETASLLWQAADGRTTLEQIAQRLCGEFEVDLQTALQDVQEIAQDLSSHGVLCLSDASADAGPAPKAAP
jgi:hypothetical protein